MMLAQFDRKSDIFGDLINFSGVAGSRPLVKGNENTGYEGVH